MTMIKAQSEMTLNNNGLLNMISDANELDQNIVNDIIQHRIVVVGPSSSSSNENSNSSSPSSAVSSISITQSEFSSPTTQAYDTSNSAKISKSLL